MDLRRRIALGLLVVAALAGALRGVVDGLAYAGAEVAGPSVAGRARWRFGLAGLDPISSLDRDLEPVRAVVPAKGVVGIAGDAGPLGNWLLVRYLLAPRELSYDAASAPWVLVPPGEVAPVRSDLRPRLQAGSALLLGPP